MTTEDYELIDEACPSCGFEGPTHGRDCDNGCDEGFIDEADDDPINFMPGEEFRICSDCYGTGFLHWCPKCGFDFQNTSNKEIVEAARNKEGSL
jgi:hypothetical protein